MVDNDKDINIPQQAVSPNTNILQDQRMLSFLIKRD